MIEWAGTRASDLHLITEHIPKRKVPRRKIEVISIPGRSGDIILSQDAFSDYEQQYSVFVDSKKYGSLDTIMPAITEWLLGNPGYQRLEDSFEPQFYRLAYVTGGEDFINIFNEYGEGTLTLICDPRRFYKDGELPITLTVSGKTIYGPSIFKAKPLIKITLNNAVNSFSSNSSSYIKFNNNDFMQFKSNGSKGQLASLVYDLDVERHTVYSNGVEINDYIDGRYEDLLLEKETLVRFGSNVQSVKIIPKWFTI